MMSSNVYESKETSEPRKLYILYLASTAALALRKSVSARELHNRAIGLDVSRARRNRPE